MSLTLPVRCFIVTEKMSGISSGPIVDRAQMGRLFRASRIVAGFDNVEAAAQAMTERTGMKISARTLYALERGEQMFSLDVVLAAAMTYGPPQGFAFFRGALRPDIIAALNEYERRLTSGNA